MRSPSCSAGQRLVTLPKRHCGVGSGSYRHWQSNDAGWVSSLAVSDKKPRVDEQFAADAVGAVEDVVAPPCYEPNGRDTAPDWRVRIADGRVVDVEVIRCTDEDAAWFRQSLAPEGKARCKLDDRLSYRWTITVADSNPSRRDRPIGKLVKVVHDVLASVESQGGSPSHMRQTAESGLLLDREVGRYCEDTGHIRVEEPRHVGDGHGMVRTYGVSLGGYYEDPQLLIDPVQECINKKDKKIDQRQLALSSDLRWLVVALEGVPALLLQDLYCSGSPASRPSLDSLSCDHFDELWLVAGSLIGEDRKEGFAVLRLSEGGNRQQHYIVPRA